jgi:hypothetical protein
MGHKLLRGPVNILLALNAAVGFPTVVVASHALLFTVYKIKKRKAVSNNHTSHLTSIFYFSIFQPKYPLSVWQVQQKSLLLNPIKNSKFKKSVLDNKIFLTKKCSQYFTFFKS